MAAEKSEAIVLRLVAFSETSLVVTMLTRDFGKISALAKGARRPKGPFESALDLLSQSRIVFLHKNTDALDLLTEAKLQRRFRSGERDLERLYAGYYVAELLNSLTEENDPSQRLYELTNNTLQRLESEQNVSRTVLRFELALLDVLGHLPSLKNCVDCHAKVELDGRIAFGLNIGGVLCTECRKGKRHVVSVSQDVMKLIRVFAEQKSVEWRSVPASSCENHELRQIINHYMAGQLGRRTKMQGYLEILGTKR